MGMAEILVKLERLDDFLDAVRPTIVRLSKIPIINRLSPIRTLVDALITIEEVLDSLETTRD